MIALKKCTKLFGSSLALDAVTIDFSGPGLVLVLGSNGAGKSTLLRACAGLLTPSSGSVEITQSVVYLGHQAMLYPQLTVKENLDFFSALQNTEVLESDIEWLELKAFSNKLVADLSQGQRARVGLARVLQEASSKALLLDEPSAAFDQRWQQIFLDKLKELSANRLTMLVTHDPERYLSFASRVVVIEQGAIAHDFRLEQNFEIEIVMQAYREVLR